MKTYVVTWAIDIDADSPREAAQKAFAIQRDPASIADVFDVVAEDEADSIKIDLSADEAVLHNCDKAGYTVEGLKFGDACEHCGQLIEEGQS